MTVRDLSRRAVTGVLLSTPAWAGTAASAASGRRWPITDTGARADGATVNTAAIQSAIDRLADRGGGTVVVPAGIFVSGALFFRPGVHLHLDRGAVLRCSNAVTRDFPAMRTRIEGHFEERFTPALVNARECHGFRISGDGTLDGAGMPVWELFWKMRGTSPKGSNFPNIGLPRARLALIEQSRGVTVEGVTFKDSQFWNLHLYRCEDVKVRGVRFLVPDDYRQAPSTDGIDLDSCRRVVIEDCFFSVTDDCIACKGSRGPHADRDADSPPVEHIRVRRCVFKRGNAILTCGSEATIVRDVVAEDCRIVGPVKIGVLKLRPDTPQLYEDIHYRNITVDSPRGPLLTIQPWNQYFDLKGEQPPHSTVRNISFTNIRGRGDAFGNIQANPGQTAISGIVLKNVDVQLTREQLMVAGAGDLRFDNVVVNGTRVAAPTG